MDITALVMTAYSRWGVQATEAVEVSLPAPGEAGTAVTFPDTVQAATFTRGCMAEGLPAKQYGTTVVILH